MNASDVGNARSRRLAVDATDVSRHMPECVSDAVGAPKDFVAVVLDISTRKRIQDALRKSEERLRLALDAAQIGGVTQRKAVEAEVAEQLRELQRRGRARLGRKVRVQVLKREANALLAQLNQPPRYAGEAPRPSQS